jgi:UDP-3-O-[3-hydroxymyristoyl] glucosamine N-acyltransferase
MPVCFKVEDFPDYVTVGKNLMWKPPICFGEWSITFDKDEKGKVIYPLRQREHNYKIIIGDDVQIGSFTNIDRGSWRDTIIGNGTKMDSLVHVAHNCQIGNDNQLFVKCCLLGSVTIGNKSTVGANATVIQHIKIGNNCFVEAGAIVNRSMPDNTRAKTWKTRIVADRDWINNGGRINW